MSEGHEEVMTMEGVMMMMMMIMMPPFPTLSWIPHLAGVLRRDPRPHRPKTGCKPWVSSLMDHSIDGWVDGWIEV
jgi:hypothetical protein